MANYRLYFLALDRELEGQYKELNNDFGLRSNDILRLGDGFEGFCPKKTTERYSRFDIAPCCPSSQRIDHNEAGL
uniref:Uncharacterized protein n=1 Tax=Talaromyces marneffei PM1 TaxID=1077442 RepID=A0A093V4G0_TALMA